MFVAAKEILFVMYGESYVENNLVLAFLAISYCLNSISNPVGSLQIATGRTDIGFKWTIIRLIISPVFIIIGALISIEAVALFYALLSLFLVIPLWFVQLKPMINVSLSEYTSKFYKPALYCLIAGLITLTITDYLFKFNMILSGIFKFLIIIPLYFLFSFYFNKQLHKDFFSLLLSFVQLKSK